MAHPLDVLKRVVTRCIGEGYPIYENKPVQYLVVNEERLVCTTATMMFQILSGGPQEGLMIIGPTDHTREATVEDFERFRVSPAGHIT